ncbi:MAG: helix-turn-helix transcriptional regulator [Clostridia bacterium]|nr:helix-turn-helix transcriptional regulator [Clostridia bacterium]
MCWGAVREHPGTEIHWHEYYEVEYIKRGNARLSINGSVFEGGEGCLTFLSPMDFHHVESTDGNKFILSVCAIREEAVPDELKLMLEGYKPPYFLKIKPESQIDKLLDYFDTVCDKNDDETSARYIAHLIISLLVREVMQGKNLIKPADMVANDNQLKNIKMIMQYIELHYNEKISREDIAREFNYSPVYLSKFFKKLTGEGLFDHIKGVRMKMAQKLLGTTDMAIGDVIKEVGYNSPSLFYKHYYEYFSTTPFLYKSQKAEKE